MHQIKIKTSYLYFLSLIFFSADIFFFGFFYQPVIALTFCFYTIILFTSSSSILLIFTIFLLALQSFLLTNSLYPSLLFLVLLSMGTLELKKILTKTKLLSPFFLITALAGNQLLTGYLISNQPCLDLFTGLKVSVNLIILLIFEKFFSQR